MSNKRYIRDYVPLKDEFLENPFSILDCRSKQWQERKREWLSLGLNNEIARENLRTYKGIERDRIIGETSTEESYVSTFDPYLAEIMYKWFCPAGGKILDPFAGGCTRGIVAGQLGYDYTGIDIREEQVVSNEAVAKKLLTEHLPNYICGDSEEITSSMVEKFDLVFSCPPYYNLEVYSDLQKDLSNMDWITFKKSYRNIIFNCAELLNKGGYAVFVVGEVRSRSGYLYGLIPYTIQCFMEAGLDYYNEIILESPIASAAVRARQCMKSGKIVKIHQNILVFKKTRKDLERHREILKKLHGWK